MSENGKNILTTAIQAIVALFGAFGGFLQKILPAQINGDEFIYTYTQVICLVVFLLIKFLMLKNSASKVWYWIIWIAFALLLGSGLGYSFHSKKTLYSVGDSSYKAIGGDLSEKAKKICGSSTYKDDSNAQLVSCEEWLLSDASTKDIAWIWTPESVQKNSDIFTILYLILATSLSIAVFSLLELIPVAGTGNKR